MWLRERKEVEDGREWRMEDGSLEREEVDEEGFYCALVWCRCDGRQGFQQVPQHASTRFPASSESDK